MVWFWSALGILLLAVEVYTTAFFAVFIAIGSFAAAVTGAAGGGVLLQCLVGAALALLGALAARPLLVGWVERRSGQVPRRLSGLVGQSALTVGSVGDKHHPGHVAIDGETWLAVSEGGQTLDSEVSVTVVAVDGTTLVVRR